MGIFKGTTEHNWELAEIVDIHDEDAMAVLSGDRVICLVTPKQHQNSEDLANAKLIASAPELLEALIEVVRISDRNHIAWDKAKEAIKKARE